MTRDENEKTLAAEYVLGLLEGEDKTGAERRLASDAAFAREVETWRTRFMAFDDATEPRPAGDALWRKIEAAIQAPARATATQSAWSRLWGNIGVLRAATLAASFAAILFAIGLVGALKYVRDHQPVMVAVLLDGDKPGAVVHVFADGRVALVPLTTINVPEGRVLEVWTLPSRERGPVSVGLMSQARTLQLNLKDLTAPRVDQLFEITLEPAGGSPIGRPTGPVLFKGTTSTAL
jgi:anti-sigma-K factor RskA